MYLLSYSIPPFNTESIFTIPFFDVCDAPLRRLSVHVIILLFHSSTVKATSGNGIMSIMNMMWRSKERQRKLDSRKIALLLLLRMFIIMPRRSVCL
mmetsp:Transcript_19672/g.41261  ORF Transcript_19672/g.41261 Transcript_19672/m.41261 type:complete len:96 (-) Transcript_19672:2375-2662(-)